MTYPLRECPYCSGMISNVSNRGNVLPPYKYRERKACSECMTASIRQRKIFEMPVLDKPIDNFIYGRMPCHTQNR